MNRAAVGMNRNASLIVQTTSSAVNGVPSCQVTPCRRWNVYTSASSLSSQLSASWGIGCEFASRSTRPSAQSGETSSVLMSVLRFGLSDGGALLRATIRVPPAEGGPWPVPGGGAPAGPPHDVVRRSAAASAPINHLVLVLMPMCLHLEVVVRRDGGAPRSGRPGGE